MQLGDCVLSLDDLAAVKADQLRKAKAILRPLMSIIAVVVFVLCFWKFQIGLLLSLVATVIAWPLMLVVIALPIGYVLGRRTARRYKAHSR
jgi:Flp pilus assembly protein TadB